MTDTTAATWLTQEAYDRLTAELAHLEGEGSAEIIERIAAARDEGDLKENGGYHAAREEQAKQEARIRELKEKLRNVQIGTPPDNGIVEPGMVVTAARRRRRDGLPARLARDRRARPTSTSSRRRRRWAPRSTAPRSATRPRYTAPNGREIQVEITDAKPFAG